MHEFYRAITILKGWDPSHFKSDILMLVSSSIPFLYNIREPKYKQNNMRHQNSRQKINRYLKFLIMILYFDIFMPWIANANIAQIQPFKWHMSSIRVGQKQKSPNFIFCWGGYRCHIYKEHFPKV